MQPSTIESATYRETKVQVIGKDYKRDRSWHKESDTYRLNDLAKQHGLTFKRVGMIYTFEDFNAYGLDQALGYAEGFDRAIAVCSEKVTDAK